MADPARHGEPDAASPGGTAPPVSLRPANDGDRFLIRRWLKEPHVARWWGSAATADAEIAMAMASPSALCRMVLWDGHAIGYAHAVDAALWGDGLPPDLPAGSWDVDILIGTPEYRGRGAGRRAVELITREVFASTLAVACAVFASIENEAAIRAYEQAGFRWRRLWHTPPHPPEWMLLLPRPSASSAAG